MAPCFRRSASRELRDKTVEEQRPILAKWVKDTCREAEKFLTAGLADVLKPGYETFERPRFERGTLLRIAKLPDNIQNRAGWATLRISRPSL